MKISLVREIDIDAMGVLGPLIRVADRVVRTVAIEARRYGQGNGYVISLGASEISAAARRINVRLATGDLVARFSRLVADPEVDLLLIVSTVRDIGAMYHVLPLGLYQRATFYIMRGAIGHRFPLQYKGLLVAVSVGARVQSRASERLFQHLGVLDVRIDMDRVVTNAIDNRSVFRDEVEVVLCGLLVSGTG